MPIYTDKNSTFREASAGYVKKDGKLRVVSTMYIKTANGFRIIWEAISRIWRYKSLWKYKKTWKY